MTASKKTLPDSTPCYVQTRRDLMYHSLRGDTPIRRPTGMDLLKNGNQGEEVEVYLEGAWVGANVLPPPTEFKFEVSCISFANENEVWSALGKALNPLYPLKPDSPIPWLKITPPSRRVK